MTDAMTPFARWCARMGERAGGKPITRKQAADLLDCDKNAAGRYFSGEQAPPRTVLLACAALERDLEPIK